MTPNGSKSPALALPWGLSPTVPPAPLRLQDQSEAQGQGHPQGREHMDKAIRDASPMDSKVGPRGLVSLCLSLSLSLTPASSLSAEPLSPLLVGKPQDRSVSTMTSVCGPRCVL